MATRANPVKQEQWKVFWYGHFGEIERCVAFCRDLAAA
jgi:acetylglutamate synthase